MKINIKNLLNSYIENIIRENYSKSVLYTFLIYLIKDNENCYDHKKYSKISKFQNKILKFLEDLLLGKNVTNAELNAAADAAANAANAANSAYAAAYAAYAAANAAYAAANAAYAAANAANAANSAYAANAAAYAANAESIREKKQKEYKFYLIELVLKEKKIDSKIFKLLYGDNNEKKKNKHTFSKT